MRLASASASSALLQFGHVREDAHSAAILGPALVDLDPATVVLSMQQRSSRVAMLSKSARR